MLRLLLAAALLLGGTHAFAQNLTTELKAAADQVVKVMKQENATAVRVGEFIGDDAFTKGTGPKVQAGLIDALVVAKVKIDEESIFKISGSYEVELEKDGKLPENVTITLTIDIKRGSVKVATHTAKIGHKDGGNADVIELTGRPLDLKDDGLANSGDRNKKIPPQLKDPPVHIDDKTKVKLSADGLFSVEVVAGPAGKKPTEVREAFVKNKVPHVNMNKGEEYILRIHNHCDHELAMAITIDGIDRAQFFQPVENRPGFLLVAAGKTIEATGWRVNDKEVKAFLVGSLADSEAVKVKGLEHYKGLNGSTDIGLIAVTAHPSFEKGKEPKIKPRDIGTGQGRPIDSPAKIVERTIGPALGKIVVRYEKK